MFSIETFSRRKDSDMVQLLHIDASFRTDGSVSREVSGAFAEHWRAANPGATYVYRDLGTHPVPHLDFAGFSAAYTPPADHSPEQRASWAITSELIDELVAADTILLGVPMYNFSIPSGVKAWLDRIITQRTQVNPQTGEGLLAGKRVVVTTARGGSYGPGMPRESFEFQERYLRAVFSGIGLDQDLTFVNTELTLVGVNPALDGFEVQAAESRAAAHRTVRELAGAALPV
jgi:FMN-dependent NADH-azoreductase